MEQGATMSLLWITAFLLIGAIVPVLTERFGRRIHRAFDSR